MVSMGVTRRVGSWALATLLLVGAAAWGGCVHRRGLVIGRITPEHFRFKTIVPLDTSEVQPDGWRAVCIHARITEGDSGATDVCKFEVGIPIRNTQQREVPLEVAQQVTAYLANEAAHAVVSKAERGELIASSVAGSSWSMRSSFERASRAPACRSASPRGWSPSISTSH